MMGREFESFIDGNLASERFLAKRIFPRILVVMLVIIGVVIILLLISNHAQAGDYGVEVQYNTPANGIGNVTPQIDFEYSVDIINTGDNNTGEDINFTVTLDAQSQAVGWTVTPSGTTIVPNLQMGSVNRTTETLIVRAPGDAMHQDSAIINITVDVIGHKGEVGCLDSLQLRANVVQEFGVRIETPGGTNKDGDPGEIISFGIWVTNDGNGNDTFSFSHTGAELGQWSVPDIDLEPDETMIVFYNFSIDAKHSPDIIPITLNATSTGNTSGPTYDTLDITITVNPTYSFELTSTAPSNKKEGEPGDDVVFTLQVKNTGTVTDSYEFFATSYDADIFTVSTIADITNLDVDYTESTTVSISITPDRSKALVGEYQIEIRANSIGDPGVSHLIVLTVEITPLPDVTLTPDNQGDDGYPEDIIDYLVEIQNSGNTQDTFLLTLEGPNKDWAEILDTSENPISEVTLQALGVPGYFVDVIVRVTIPGAGETIAYQIYPITLKATSTILEGVHDSAMVSTNVEQWVELDLAYAGSGLPQKDYNPNEKSPEFSFRVTNYGNIDEDSIEVIVGDLPEDWDFTPKIIPDILEPGETITFQIEFTIPPDGDVDDYEMDVYVVSSADPSVESQHVVITISVVMPDLVISSGDISGLEDTEYLKGRVGTAITITATVHNEGTSRAESIQVKFYEGSTVVDTKSISSLDPMGQRDVDFRWTVVAEQVELKVKAVPIQEINEGNNEATIYLDLRPDFSFYGEEIKFNNSNPNPKDRITITAYVQNNGGNADDISVTFLYGGKAIGSKSIDLDFGETKEVSVDWEVPDKEGESLILEVEIDHSDAARKEKSSKSIDVAEGDGDGDGDGDDGVGGDGGDGDGGDGDGGDGDGGDGGSEPGDKEGEGSQFDFIWILLCIIIGVVALLVGYLLGGKKGDKPAQVQEVIPKVVTYEGQNTGWESNRRINPQEPYRRPPSQPPLY
ncbi:MAG: hypothetical protein JSW00_10620 [Thermoplasmata archaeon]|nr:MAG: hypothetical protein JSW00_10620 [Thermoplasmata archaeon]